MKKLILSIVALVATVMSANAQSEWKMVITQTDGTKTEILTSDVKDIQYVQQMPYEADANVDQIIIKELYSGGCLKDDGKNFQYDKCVILYNNCPQKAVVNNLCFGAANPANAQYILKLDPEGNFTKVFQTMGSVSLRANCEYDGHLFFAGADDREEYGEDGKLVYEKDGFIPVWNGIFYYPYSLVIEPYSQVVINIHGAIDNTQTVTNSVNYVNKDYYAMYDPESGYNHTGYYPTPASEIPTSHYLKAVRYGLGTAWSLSVSSPALVMFQTEGDPAEYVNNADNI